MSTTVSTTRRIVAPTDVATAAMAVAAPVVRSLIEERSARAIAVVVVLGALAAWRMGRTAERAFVLRWLIAASAVVVVGVLVAGWWTAGLLAIGLLVGDSACRSRPIVPGLPGAVAIGRVVGRAVATPVRLVTFAALSLVVVLVPWVVGRIARVDPLWSPAGWGVQRGHRTDATRPWSGREGARQRGGKVRVGAVMVAVAAVLAGALVWPLDLDLGQDPPIPPAFADAPWYPTYRADSNWVQYSSTQEPLATVRIKDARTRTINIIDGKRVTWAPPECGCRRLRVWFYGGSTTFGLGQRDEHTIPSQLARAAWADGVALDVENRGVGGDTHWEEAQRFAWDLTAEEPPDLVVFYDGTNEFMAATGYLGDAPSVIRNEFWDKYVERVPFAETDPPPGVSPVPTTPPGPTTVEGLGQAIVARYESSRQLSLLSAREAGVPTAYFWQPTADLRIDIAGEPPISGAEFARARTAAARAALAPDVIDIADVFDGVKEPLYYDTLHTNEHGAELVGAAIYAALGQRIDQLGGGGSNA